MKIKRLTETAKLPTRGSEYAAGYDLYVDSDKIISVYPHKTVMLPTNIALEIPHGYFGAIHSRSGLSTKKGLALVNGVAVIDEDYRGAIGIPIHNYGNLPQSIEPYERVAQLVITPYKEVEFEEVEELSDTARGNGGFGSTGIN